jgi:hypothetical protein
LLPQAVLGTKRRTCVANPLPVIALPALAAFRDAAIFVVSTLAT